MNSKIYNPSRSVQQAQWGKERREKKSIFLTLKIVCLERHQGSTLQYTQPSCKPYCKGMCGRAPSPSQTAGCLSQVIFVKQVLFSEFLPGIIINTMQPVWGKKEGGRILRRIFKPSWQQNPSVTTKSCDNKLPCQSKFSSTFLKVNIMD